MASESRSKALLFDLDGTLTDPGDGFVSCVNHALRQLGFRDASASDLKKNIGPPLEDTLRYFVGGDEAKMLAALSLYRERYGRLGFLENIVYPGIENSLDQLYAKGIPLFLATSKPVVFAERILDHFGLTRYFQRVYGSQLDGTHAKKASLISHILKSESLDPGSTIMIGDRSHDVVGAAANQVRAIGVLWGYGSEEELIRAGAVALCNSPALLPATASAVGNEDRMFSSDH